MKVMVLTSAVYTFGPVPMVWKIDLAGDQGKNQDSSEHNSVKISKNTRWNRGYQMRLAVI